MNLKRLPKEILILGETYRLKRVKGLLASEQLEGYVSPHEYLIVVDASLGGRVLERVLLHEIAHAYAFESGLHEILSSQAIEQFCQTISALISQLRLLP